MSSRLWKRRSKKFKVEKHPSLKLRVVLDKRSGKLAQEPVVSNNGSADIFIYPPFLGWKVGGVTKHG
jgi:hypothetical protein